MSVNPVGSRPSVSPLGQRLATSPVGLSTNAPVAQRLANAASAPRPASQGTQAAAGEEVLRQTFESVIGQTLFGQLLKSMRKTVGKPAYFHGGRAEEIFQQQLDQVLAEKMSQQSAASFVEPMFELFTLQRQ